MYSSKFGLGKARRDFDVIVLTFHHKCRFLYNLPFIERLYHDALLEAILFPSHSKRYEYIIFWTPLSATGYGLDMSRTCVETVACKIHPGPTAPMGDPLW